MAAEQSFKFARHREVRYLTATRLSANVSHHPRAKITTTKHRRRFISAFPALFRRPRLARQQKLPKTVP